MANTVGSIWRKWDLHVHTPASFHWEGEKLEEHSSAEREHLCRAILARMNSLDVISFCIMDYWTFDGYILLREIHR